MVAVYLTVSNRGPGAAQLTGVEVEGALSSDLHETSMDQAGVSSMRTVSSLDIPSGESRSFAPGGLHVMAMGLNRHLREGDQLKVSLHFKGQPSLQVTAMVKP
jgi:copper(I)-binding protein